MPKPPQVPVRQGAAAEGELKRPEPRVNSASQESVLSKTRRLFTASEKLRLVKAAEAALASGERGALEALLREEGIYSSQLSAWRTQFGAARVRSHRNTVSAGRIAALGQTSCQPVSDRPFDARR